MLPSVEPIVFILTHYVTGFDSIAQCISGYDVIFSRLAGGYRAGYSEALETNFRVSENKRWM